jgi:hypothetical protein
MDNKQIAKNLLLTAKNLLSEEYKYYKFHSKGDLHGNVLLNTLEDKYGITFRDYDLSTTGIKAKNQKTEEILKKLFSETSEDIEELLPELNKLFKDNHWESYHGIWTKTFIEWKEVSEREFKEMSQSERIVTLMSHQTKTLDGLNKSQVLRYLQEEITE